MFIDVHAHLDFYDDAKIKEIVERARKEGVGVIVNSGIEPKRTRKTMELASKYPEIQVALGIYPLEMLKMSEKTIEEEFEFIRKNKGKIIAIGEIGMDLKEASDVKKQKENFERLLKLALELGLPVLIHSRKAELECIEVLERLGMKKVIMHCFSGKMSLVKRAKENDWYFTIPTNVTFSEHFQNMIKEIPIERLLCETDSPFLHPVKGKRDNEPANVIESYKKIAEVKNISLKECEKKIEENFKRVFRKE
jgi:TatD DNase family protein